MNQWIEVSSIIILKCTSCVVIKCCESDIENQSLTDIQKITSSFFERNFHNMAVCFSYQDEMCWKKLAHNRARTMEIKILHEENRNCYGSLVVTFHTVQAGKSRIKLRFTSINVLFVILKMFA